MHHFEETFVVPDVTPQRCFDYLADPANGADWASFADEIIGHGEPGPGRRVEARIGFLGVTFGVDSHVTVYEEPVEYVLSGTVPFRGHIGARLRPVERGTEVEAFFGVEPGRFFPVPGVVLRRALRRQFDRDVAALRERLRALA